MHAFTAFIRANASLLFFGVLLTYFSGFGQTFLISLYIPEIERAFQLSNTALSSLYAVATTASAFSLPWIGRLIDTWPLQRFSSMVVVGLIVACLLLSFAVHPLLVLLGFFGLRLFGQGLMGHTSMSTMARAYEANRGKAISLASLGHPFGEATLPLLVALLIGAVGWRMSLRFSALSLVILVLPLLFLVLKKQTEQVLHPAKGVSKSAQRRYNPLLLLKKKSFWRIAPAVFILGFLNTAIFFFQLKLGNSRGWESAWVAGSLSVYALASAVSLTAAGPLVDRLSARRLFPWMLLPYLAGLLVLAWWTHPLAYPVSLALLAVSNGGAKTIKNALFAELFGVDIIGAVRSFFTMVMVFSTALGPLSFGLLLDSGWTYSAVFLLSVLIVLLVILWSWKNSDRSGIF